MHVLACFFCSASSLLRFSASCRLSCVIKDIWKFEHCLETRAQSARIQSFRIPNPRLRTSFESCPLWPYLSSHATVKQDLPDLEVLLAASKWVFYVMFRLLDHRVQVQQIWAPLSLRHMLVRDLSRLLRASSTFRCLPHESSTIFNGDYSQQ